MERKPILITIVAVVAVFTTGFFLFSAPSDFPKGIIYEIEEGKTLRGISLDLKEKNIIRSRFVFEAFSILYGGERHIREGYYLFEDKMPVFETARRVARGDRHLAPIRVTIPEGFTAAEIAETFSTKLPDFDEEKFLAEATGSEGYLFPDTYFFFPGDNADEAIRHLKNNYEKKIVPLRSKIKAAGRTEKDIINMASIIEKEAKGDGDRNLISGILWKRYTIGMPLQADAAPETYERAGLPTSPIGNPGIESIEAAIYPAASTYLYYLHDKDGTIHYARNFEEHKINIARYLK